MLKSIILQPEAFERFIQFNKQNNGASVCRTYLEKASVIRVFLHPENPDRWVAGYVVNAAAPLRYLGTISEQQCREALQTRRVRADQFAEITLLCRDRQYDWSARPQEREMYYATSLYDALKTGKRYVLGGAVEEKHRAVQMEILSTLLYKGELNLSGKNRFGWLYYASRYGIIWSGLRRFGLSSWKQFVSAVFRKARPAVHDQLPTA